MPFKSESQRRKFAEMVKQGKMTKEEFAKWNDQTPAKLPERLHPKPVKNLDDLKARAKDRLRK